ncbi:MAG: HipA N-terminal domain-containing protein [Candidatus Marinimicrobia bacterium]|nr:HipA N-terminal domain-containing protein [Candidatus Neomarinimicrobiota bacterium]
MKKAEIRVHNKPAGLLSETDSGKYIYQYLEDYDGFPVSFTLPFRKEPYEFNSFPAFFDGLLPEGIQLEALLKSQKIDRNDYFSQLLAVGRDTVGAITIIAEKK